MNHPLVPQFVNSLTKMSALKPLDNTVCDSAKWKAERHSERWGGTSLRNPLFYGSLLVRADKNVGSLQYCCLFIDFLTMIPLPIGIPMAHNN